VEIRDFSQVILASVKSLVLNRLLLNVQAGLVVNKFKIK
jgi:hypothetical protein